MKMVFSLVKKDFMLIRKTVALIMLVVIGFPIFFAFQFEAEEAFDSMGTVIFGALAFMCTFMIYHSASLEELKYNGPYCLVATPYSRKKIVIGKYCTLLVSYIMVCIGYIISSIVSPVEIPRISFSTISITLLGLSIFFGIYLPLIFKLGYTRVQSVGGAVVFLTPFLMPQIKKVIESGKISLGFLEALSTTQISVIALVLGILISVFSSMKSMSIFERKDL